VTSTVDSLDLITSSILSKKLAAGLDGLVLDVKTGSGAFMTSMDQARELAEALTQTASAAGCPTSALITDMSQPLVPACGNALEVAEVMRVLTAPSGTPIEQLSAALGGVVLAGAGVVADVEAGMDRINQAIRSGAAAERFGKMLAALGGPVRFVEDWQRFLPEATVIRAVTAQTSGVVAAIDGTALGHAVVALGGGRLVESDQVNPAVGLDRAVQAVRAAMQVSGEAVTVPDLILERVG